jgi:hypothetical protein
MGSSDRQARDPEKVAERQADEERVRQAILKLGNEQRRVIVLRFVEDLEYPEVAEITGKSVAAVRVIQHRALCALRKMMRAESVAGWGLSRTCCRLSELADHEEHRTGNPEMNSHLAYVSSFRILL